jgi:flagellar hook-associated protein 2
VLDAIGRSGSSTVPGVSVIGATSAAVGSSRQITVTQSASMATLVGLPTPPPAAGTSVSLNIVTPDGSYNVAFTTGSTWSQTAGNLNAALRAAGVRAQASSLVNGGVEEGLTLTDSRYGSGHQFTVSGGAALGIDGTSTDGTDAAGTIDGVAFTATGRSITTNGIVLQIATTDVQLAALGGSASGTATLTDGLAGALSRIGALGSSTGPAQASKTSLGDQIADLQKRFDAFDERLDKREDTLRQRFTNMQMMLEKLGALNSSFNNLAASS